MPKDRVVIVGAGVAGLVSAFALAARGLDVTVLERGSAPGGKMRQIAVGSSQIDSGPTVFTMRWVFDELFAAAGKNFADHIRLRQLDILARHAWDEHGRLDLFADRERSVEAIGDFAGAAEALAAATVFGIFFFAERALCALPSSMTLVGKYPDWRSCAMTSLEVAASSTPADSWPRASRAT